MTLRGRSPLLAKRELILPTWYTGPVADTPQYVRTFGPEVVDVVQSTGMEPDPEQAWMLDLLFAEDERDRPSVFEFDLIAARQMMKTGLILMAELGWLYVTEAGLIVHSAHELDTTAEAFRDLAALIENTEDLSAELKPTRGERPGIDQGNGRWAIELKDDRRVKYKARTKSGGRGLSGDKVVLDEGFALTPAQMGSLLGTLAARQDPQVVIASSAGKVDSTVLIEKRDEGRKIGKPRRAYVEYGDPHPGEGCERGDKCTHEKTEPGCALDDVERWKTWMPALGGRVQVETILALRDSMPADEFAREFMVWWDIEEEKEPSAVDFDDWRDLVNRKAKQPDRACIVLDVSPNRATSSIGVAGDGRRDRTLVMSKTKPGTTWVVPALVKIQEKRDIVSVALHPGGQAGILIPALIRAQIEYELLTTVEMAQACAAFQEAVKHGQIEHAGQVEFDEAVRNAVVRKSAGGEGEVWDRRDKDGADISPVVAGSVAAYRWSKEADYDADASIY